MDGKPPFETFEFFQFIKKAFGKTYLNKIFSIGGTQIQRWCRNPRMAYEDKPARNPLDRLEAVLTDLVEGDYKDIAYLAVSRLARIVGCELQEVGWPKPDKNTIAEEILDDLPMIAGFQKTCRDPKHIGELMKSFHDTVEEMRQTVVKVCEEKDWDYN